MLSIVAALVASMLGCAWAQEGAITGHFYVGEGWCRNSEGEQPTRWDGGLPTGTKMDACAAICVKVGVANCTGYAYRDSNIDGYCEVYGKGLPTKDEQPEGTLDGLANYWPYPKRDDAMVKSSGDTGWACYPRCPTTCPDGEIVVSDGTDIKTCKCAPGPTTTTAVATTTPATTATTATSNPSSATAAVSSVNGGGLFAALAIVVGAVAVCV